MFKYADIGRMWVQVELPVGEGDAPATIWLLQTLYTRAELRAREQALATRAHGGLSARDTLRTVEDVQALMDEVNAIEDADLEELAARTHDWRDVCGEDGKPAEFTAERLQALLTFQWFAQATRRALFAASREGPRKNSSPGPGGSPGQRQA